ncbi:hypothetical protein VOLCADRAFT_87173 [Volvox carteri f. nagariensis]|uniref:SOUL heme-binding protein n=1 Tax=Volvox carteri f. nagariensis TaxID=3068 RepID=D8TKD3_VOLCA|nr:uncharacterized protein VOLCADRAFT_87173 [Volvox carteri f. nagariensis]EFJ52227.1 hypothetical protein VOLCADRAFT_87173 [Volvox carteri f. nagariensis]|eukprot:XP_002947001.1 hypothetical protein VOLCADRAFT_87173 [Volvox carteri f. nagariensis]
MVRVPLFAALAVLLVASCASFRAQAGRIEEPTDRQQVISWQPPSFCRGKDCPEYQVQESRDDVELRRYKKAHWISTNVTNAKFGDAYDEGYKRLQKYVSGDNVDATKLPQTNPSFMILYVADAKAHTLQNTFTVEYFVPFELQDKPPKPNSTELAVTPVNEQDVWVVSFGGFATEDVVIQRGFEFIDNLTGGGIDVHTEFIGLALYDQPARLVKRHNEIWLWPKSQPPSASGGTAASSTVDGEVDIAMRFKRIFEAVVKRMMNVAGNEN